VAFDLPQGDLPQLRLLEQVQQATALIRRRGSFLGGRLAVQEPFQIVFTSEVFRPLAADQVDGTRDGPCGQQPPQVVATHQLQWPLRISEATVDAVEGAQSQILIVVPHAG
jgi:hypothetical protein